ncbi:dihydrodipicolinate synthase family protein [Aeoliella sp.]|uniref:dihydrodipicolinate synthase family protein n=1 Tax=Aeoliella sp. TaxID=2795800 RepID=UPI003CCBEDD3
MDKHATDGQPGPAASHFAHGVVAATVTPYCQNGRIDLRAASNLYRQLFSHGADGVFVASSTGEAEMLGEADRESLVLTACEASGGQRTVFVGVTSLGVGDTVRLANRMERAGADCGVVMAPAFLRYSQPELVDYFWRIADGSDLPIAVYHHPRATNSLDVETIAILAGHPNIVALKDTSGTLARAMRLLQAVEGTDIRVLQGSEHLVLESLSRGAAGMVTALAGVVPDWHAALFQAWQQGDLKIAAEQQERLIQLWQMFKIQALGDSMSNFTRALKVGISRRGWLSDPADLFPSANVPDELLKNVEQLYDSAGIPAQGRIDSAHPGVDGPAAPRRASRSRLD